MTYQRFFPRLNQENHRITSQATRRYNCIAWAAGYTNNWWDPFDPQYYWPEGIPLNVALETMVLLFKQHGYTPCEFLGMEEGFEKIAIFGDAGIFTHVARQVENGGWTSKLGGCEDIEHTSLDCLEGREYGSICRIMKRQNFVHF